MSSSCSGSSSCCPGGRLPGCHAEKQQQGQRTLRRQTADDDDDCFAERGAREGDIALRRDDHYYDFALRPAFRIAELPCVG